VTGKRIVARFAARLLGCVRASLQPCEERIGRIIEDVHRGEREHRRVVIQRDLKTVRYIRDGDIVLGAQPGHRKNYKPTLVRTSVSGQSLRMS
jgi:hypothetical protein